MGKNTNRSTAFEVHDYRKVTYLWLLLLGIFLLSATQAFAAVESKAAKEVTPVDKKGIIQKTIKLQIPFIFNQGQIQDKHVKFYARTFGGITYVNDNGDIVYLLSGIDTQKNDGRGLSHTATIKKCPLKEKLIDSKIPSLQGIDKAKTKVNYFIGNDKTNWKTNISTYNLVSFGEVYNGINLSLKAYGDTIEKIFTVDSGADPNTIRLKIEGTKKLRINDKGELEAETRLGLVKFSKPLAYQEKGDNRRNIQVAYNLSMDTYGFTLGDYDKSIPLIIDPLLSSTFLGGSFIDKAYSIAVDSSGDVYVAGHTDDSTFPTPAGAYDTTFNGLPDDAFVSKFDADLSSLLSSTYIGGSVEDRAWALAIDESDPFNTYVYVTGRTYSTDFPHPSQPAMTGSHSAFISKLSYDLGTLVASRFVGTATYAGGNAIDIDSSGNPYIAGYAGGGLSYPVPGYDQFWTALNGQEGFVVKLSDDLSIQAATYLGGGTTSFGITDQIFALKIASDGTVCVAGHSDVINFPTTTGAYRESNPGSGVSISVFVSKFNANLTTLSNSTFIGIGSPGSGISIDNSGGVYVAGYTSESGFPTTLGSYDQTHNGGIDVFVSKLNSDLSNLDYSTFVGGFGDDEAFSLAADSLGDVFVTGESHSGTGSNNNYPTTTGAYDDTFNQQPDPSSDVFVTKLDSTLSTILASTFLGAANDEAATSMAIDSFGAVYVTGHTGSLGPLFAFPTTPGAYDQTYNGGESDVFVSYLTWDLQADSDNDGMGDLWESFNGLSVGTNDASSNPDTDGLNNIDEYWNRTNPQVADSDGDTVSDGDEVAAGTDPNDPADYPIALNLFVVDGGVLGDDANHGRNWAYPKKTIQAAIDAARTGDQIWVKEGIYNLTQKIAVNKTVAIYGSFNGTETQLSDRDITIIDSIVDGAGFSSGQSCFVISVDATIDGFLIRNNPGLPGSEGGGIFVYNTPATIANCIFENNGADYGGAIGIWSDITTIQPHISNCRFSGNTSAYDGGAISNRGDSNATITNCTFIGNNANGNGGAVYNNDSNPTISYCTFSNNTAAGDGGGIANHLASTPLVSAPAIINCIFDGNIADNGGGIYNNAYLGDPSPTITSCIFSNNRANEYDGGAICNIGSSPPITNCTFYGNSAFGNGDGVYNFESIYSITNCIFWGDTPEEIYNSLANLTISNSNIEGSGGSGAGWNAALGTDGGGNIDADPLFVNPAGDDFHLKIGSPCIDAGDNGATGIPATDFEGDPRIIDGNGDLTATVDMGADEYNSAATDSDGDGVLDSFDNCPAVANADQQHNIYIEWPAQPPHDQGDACDDEDGDGIFDADDNCPFINDPNQADWDDDGFGDVCSDFDGDGQNDDVDPWPFDPDNDYDNDGIPADQNNICPFISVPCGVVDNCPWDANPSQEDSDNDGFGDACDENIGPVPSGCHPVHNPCPEESVPDEDQDGINDSEEPAVCVGNPDCDGDGVLDGEDNCIEIANGAAQDNQADADGDGYGNACDDDDDNDTVCDGAAASTGDGTPAGGCTAGPDNCPLVANTGQADNESDGIGDACDTDDDDDGVPDGTDNCPFDANPGQDDLNGNGIGDACDTVGDTILLTVEAPVGDDITASWLPRPIWNSGNSTWDPEEVTIVARLNVGGIPETFVSEVTFLMTSRTNLEGVAINDEEMSTYAYDYSFDGNNPDVDTVTANGGSSEVATILYAWDFGGRVTIKASTTYNGSTVEGTITLPLDTDGDTLPDECEIMFSDAGLDPTNKFSYSAGTSDAYVDIDWSLENNYDTDGLLNHEECRGIIKDPPVGDLYHEYLDPTKKDLFVRGDNFRNSLIKTYDTQPNPLGDSDVLPFSVDYATIYTLPPGTPNAFEEARITIHDVTGMASFVDPNNPLWEPPNLDILVVTNQTERGTDGLIDTIVGKENGTINHPSISLARYWTWDLKGASYIGTAVDYAIFYDPDTQVTKRGTHTYYLPLMHYVYNRPYIDVTDIDDPWNTSENTCGSGVPGKLDALSINNDWKVEDWYKENGTGPDSKGNKKEDHCIQNAQLDGDRMNPIWKTLSYVPSGGVSRDWHRGAATYRSVFDADGDGYVENPIVEDPSVLNPHLDDGYEYTAAQVQLHTILHEMGHAVGMDEFHTTDDTCLMYENSNNWGRAGHFGTSARSQAKIHNN